MAIIKPKMDFGFPVIEEGVHIFRCVGAELEDKEKGQMLKLTFEVVSDEEYDESEGLRHFEYFPFWSIKIGEKEAYKGLEKMTGCLVTMGVLKEMEYKSEEITKPSFIKEIMDRVLGKEVKMEIYHDIRDSTKVEGAKKTFTKARKYIPYKRKETTSTPKTKVQVNDDDDYWQ